MPKINRNGKYTEFKLNIISTSALGPDDFVATTVSIVQERPLFDGKTETPGTRLWIQTPSTRQTEYQYVTICMVSLPAGFSKHTESSTESLIHDF